MKHEVIYFLVSDLRKEARGSTQTNLLTAPKWLFYLQQEL